MASECTDRGFAEKKKKGIPIDDQAIAIVLSECEESRESKLNFQSKLLALNATLLKAKLDIELEGLPTEQADKLTKEKKDLSEIVSSRLKSKLNPSLKVGSLESYDGRYATFFFLEGNIVNGRGWGVTKSSIPTNIKTAKEKPYVITSNMIHPNSVYGTIFDHPSLDHLVPLGLAKYGEIDLNDENLLIKFQSQFRVGKMFETFHSNTDDTWRVEVELDEKFRDITLPPFVSPAVWKDDDSEPDEAMSKWHVLHLAGLDVRPAYGDKAIKKAECVGQLMKCQPQLRVASTKIMLPCDFRSLINRMERHRAFTAVLTSPTISDTQVQNVFGCKKKDETGNCLSAKTMFGLEGDTLSTEGTRKNLVDCIMRDEHGNCTNTNAKKPRLK